MSTYFGYACGYFWPAVPTPNNGPSTAVLSPAQHGHFRVPPCSWRRSQRVRIAALLHGRLQSHAQETVSTSPSRPFASLPLLTQTLLTQIFWPKSIDE
jgi:hypothetical protein